MKKTEKFDNGINLITHKLSNTHCVTISVNFKVGSIYETAENNGITHLIEHLFFRQWDNLNQEKLYYEMMSMGAEIIGKTYNDFVSFSITVVPDYFIKAFSLIIRCLNNFKWNEQSISLEKRVVCKQIENSYQSFQNWIDYYYFKNTVYEHLIMGTSETINSLSVDAINSWKEKYFCCNNSCIIITGNYSDKDLTDCYRVLSKINNHGKSLGGITYLPQNFNNRNYINRFSIVNDDSDNTEVTVFLDVNKEYDFETVRLLSAILGEGCGSILSKILREENGLTDDVYTSLMCFDGFYRLSNSFTVKNDDFFQSMLYFFEGIKKLKKNISKEEYQSSICFFTINQIMDLDNTKTLNDRYVLCDFVLPSIISEPFALKEKYEKITRDDLQNYSTQIFTSNNISFLIQTNNDANEVKSYLENLVNDLD